MLVNKAINRAMESYFFPGWENDTFLDLSTFSMFGGQASNETNYILSYMNAPILGQLRPYSSALWS